MRIGPAVAVGLGLLVLTALNMNATLTLRSLPTIDGYYRVIGLHERAEVIRDGFGVPRIKANNMHDLFFLQGYITAQDRFAQMDEMRRTARAAIPQPGSGAGGELRLALDAYAAGVSKYIDQHASAQALPLPVALSGERPRPWTLIDSIWIASAFIDRTPERSSCFAIPGTRTGRGVPIVAAELRSHAPEPGWYEIGLEWGAHRSVGISLPGVPGLVAGHNGRLAWALHGTPGRPGEPTWTVAAMLEASLVPDVGTFTGRLASEVPFTTCVADGAGAVRESATIQTNVTSTRTLDVETLRRLLGDPGGARAAARIIIDLGDLDASKAVLSTGQSGHRASFHYDDQKQIWEAGQLHRLVWTRERIARLEGQLVLRPR